MVVDVALAGSREVGTDSVAASDRAASDRAASKNPGAARRRAASVGILLARTIFDVDL